MRHGSALTRQIPSPRPISQGISCVLAPFGETAQALAALETWPDSPHSRALAALARFAQDRTN
jgi:hypothetical protein